MPVRVLEDPGEVIEAINETPKSVVVHYWAPWMGPNSPLLPLFEEADETRGGEVDLVIVNSGFIPPPHSPDEMPLTVLHKGGEEVETAPFDPIQIQQLIDNA
ncbi:uncharacterized protein BO95DRAFT_468235 [Aspergillus brunneoviolaceus CBS 621.78]|uniref:Uncharacterized protein n=1 Tax=Aspergillus brunneoviolaceus CBS 621.78 TaxID=1450534 RepID=A0ACD1FVM4_9EURO|nr:hypothetical protein BO95DRAFT_468235 [Aspergillus brunneoviolaceus CBS 621.78]RAH41051.1 hypothetical protein BO95DRAFT_468235 [Aspergillus brunneoviolaceus CBS 621.78]